MAGNMLTMAASLTCPHGATVVVTPSNPTTTVDGSAIATANDTLTVVGWPFQLPTVPESVHHGAAGGHRHEGESQ
jgi:hypothetical protein